MKNRTVRVEIRVKRSQGLTPDCCPRARCRVRSVRGRALGSADRRNGGERLRGCGRRVGGPAQPRCSEQLEAGGHRQLLRSRLAGVLRPHTASLVQWEHPDSLEQKPRQMESDVQKLGHKSNTMDSGRSWTTGEWVMQLHVHRPFISQTEIWKGRKTSPPNSAS